jgi:hypothetical protein
MADKQRQVGTSPCDSPHSLYESEPAYSPYFMNFDLDDVEGFDTFYQDTTRRNVPCFRKK